MDDTGTLRDMVGALKPGDTVSGGFAHRHFPEHTILEAISDRTACVAYRVTTDEWSVTGHGYVVTSMELTRFAKNWRVVRVGDAEAERERREDELNATRQEGILDGQESAGTSG